MSLSFKTLKFCVRINKTANAYISKNAKISIAFFDANRKILKLLNISENIMAEKLLPLRGNILNLDKATARRSLR